MPVTEQAVRGSPRRPTVGSVSVQPTISPLRAEDTGELLTLQRAAYVTEAQLYGDTRLPALTQTLEDLGAELAQGVALRATNAAGRMVGAVRARSEAHVLHIGRLVVAPDWQGRGLGSALLQAVEDEAPAGTSGYALFTGHLSAANLRLYERRGYREVRREELHAGVTLVHLYKPAPSNSPR